MMYGHQQVKGKWKTKLVAQEDEKKMPCWYYEKKDQWVTVSDTIM